MVGAFQPNAFQSNAFQEPIVPPETTTTLPTKFMKNTGSLMNRRGGM